MFSLNCWVNKTVLFHYLFPFYVTAMEMKIHSKSEYGKDLVQGVTSFSKHLFVTLSC